MTLPWKPKLYPDVNLPKLLEEVAYQAQYPHSAQSGSGSYTDSSSNAGFKPFPGWPPPAAAPPPATSISKTPATTPPAITTTKASSSSARSASTSATSIYNADLRSADTAAGLHRGSFDWYDNLFPGAGRVGYNTGLVPPDPAPPAPPADPLSITAQLGTLVTNQPIPTYPRAKWPTERPASTGTPLEGNSTFPFPKLTLVNGQYVDTSSNMTDKLLYGSNPSLAYAQLVDPMLGFYKPTPAKYLPYGSRHRSTRRTKTGNRANPRTKSLTTPGLSSHFVANAPALVPSRLPLHPTLGPKVG